MARHHPGRIVACRSAAILFLVGYGVSSWLFLQIGRLCHCVSLRHQEFMKRFWSVCVRALQRLGCS
jgi:hypothetical protein